MEEKLDRLIKMVWVLIILVTLLLFVNVVVGKRITADIHKIHVEISKMHIKMESVEKKLEMTEQARPPIVEACYLDEETEKWLNDPNVTGGGE